jgi:hypothetical protein
MEDRHMANRKEHLENLWEVLEKTHRLILGETFLNSTEPMPEFSDSASLKELNKKFTERIPVTQMSLEQIADAVRSCSACVLHSGRTHAVPGSGVINARVMIVGEAPGVREDAAGEPFVGKSGK